MPLKDKNERRKRTVSLYLGDKGKKRLEHLACMKGMTVSQYVTWLVNGIYKKDLEIQDLEGEEKW